MASGLGGVGLRDGGWSATTSLPPGLGPSRGVSYLRAKTTPREQEVGGAGPHPPGPSQLVGGGGGPRWGRMGQAGLVTPGCRASPRLDRPLPEHQPQSHLLWKVPSEGLSHTSPVRGFPPPNLKLHVLAVSCELDSELLEGNNLAQLATVIPPSQGRGCSDGTGLGSALLGPHPPVTPLTTASVDPDVWFSLMLPRS